MIKVWDDKPILNLYAQGYSSYRIVEMLDLPITARQVSRIVKTHGLARPKAKPTAGRPCSEHLATMLACWRCQNAPQNKGLV